MALINHTECNVDLACTILCRLKTRVTVRLRVFVQQEVEGAERADRGDLQRALWPRVRTAAQPLLPEGWGLISILDIFRIFEKAPTLAKHNFVNLL